MDEQFNVLLEDEEGFIRPRKRKESKVIKQQGNGWQLAGVAGQIGFDVALPMVGGLIIGIKLDEVWGTQPKATLLLFCLGILLGCTSLIRIVRDAVRKG